VIDPYLLHSPSLRGGLGPAASSTTRRSATTTRSFRPARGRGSFSPDAGKVYDAVVVRLIAAFYPACRKEVTSVAGVSNAVPFRAKGVRVLEPGWTVLYPRKEGAREDDEQEGARPDCWILEDRRIGRS
jgi:DNA topoisomerase IA